MLTIPTRRILIFGFLAFVLIGLEQGILGLFVAEFGAQLHRSPEELGLFFALHGVGSAIVTGSALIGWLEKRNNKRIAMASLALGAGGFLVVFGESWTLKLVAAPLLGIGFGGLSMSFNTLFVTHFSQKNAGLLNVLNATYGLGAVAAPWLVSTGIYSGTEVFLAIAAISLVVMIGAWGIDDRVPSNLPTFASEDSGTSRVAPLLVTAFLILFLEAGLTYWMPSLLAETSDNELIGASYMAAFFGWFVVVRLGAAALAMWITTLGFALIGLERRLRLTPVGEHGLYPSLGDQLHRRIYGPHIPQCLCMDADDRKWRHCAGREAPSQRNYRRDRGALAAGVGMANLW